MTDLMPAREMPMEKALHGRRYLRDPAGNCTSPRRHGPSQGAWQEGCRCPAALEAHRAWLDRERENKAERDRHKPPAIDDQGRCIAGVHGTASAYRRHGCRCPQAVAEYRTYRSKYIARGARNRRSWTYVLSHDPRKRWRGPDSHVDRINLLLLMGGVIDNPTVTERMVAAIRLTRMPNRWGTGINTPKEVAAIIGEQSGDRITSLLERRDRLRGQRTDRRLADARWRQARRERAVAHGRGHDASGHPLHPLWVAAGYVALADFAPNPPAVGRD